MVFDGESTDLVIFAKGGVGHACEKATVVVETAEEYTVGNGPSERWRCSSFVKTQERFATCELEETVEWTSVRAVRRTLHADFERVKRMPDDKFGEPGNCAPDKTFY